MKSMPMTTADVEVDYSAGIHHLADLLARATIIVLFSMMCVRFATDFLETGRITGLFLLLSEAIHGCFNRRLWKTKWKRRHTACSGQQAHGAGSTFSLEHHLRFD